MKLTKNESGQALSEYLILTILIALVAVAATRTLGTTIRGKLELAERHITKVQVD